MDELPLKIRRISIRSHWSMLKLDYSIGKKILIQTRDIWDTQNCADNLYVSNHKTVCNLMKIGGTLETKTEPT